MTVPNRAQTEMMFPIAGGLAASVPASVVALQHAGVRVVQAMNRHLDGRTEAFKAQFRAGVGQELFERATRAEMRTRDSGWRVILEALGPGPPKAWDGEVSDSLRAVLGRKRG